MEDNDDLMKALRAQYRADLRELIIELEQTKNEDATRRIAHRLRGSGGSYGYPLISEAAARAEEATAAALSSELSGLLEVLRRVVEEGPESE